MIKNLINSKLLDLSNQGVDLHIIKKYENSGQDEPFITENLAVLLIRSGNVRIKLQEIIQNLSARDRRQSPSAFDAGTAKWRNHTAPR